MTMGLVPTQLVKALFVTKVGSDHALLITPEGYFQTMGLSLLDIPTSPLVVPMDLLTTSLCFLSEQLMKELNARFRTCPIHVEAAPLFSARQ